MSSAAAHPPAQAAGSRREACLPTQAAQRGGLTEHCREPATAGAAQRFKPDGMFDLTGSTALVTGAAQGIGAAIALGLARQGADVVCADMNEGKAAAVVKQIQSLGRKAVAVHCDVRQRHLVTAAVAEAVEALGGIGPDILVTSAGIMGRLEAAHQVSHEGWTEVFSSNLEGSYNAAQAVYPHFLKAGRGKIVFIASIAAVRGAGAQVAYASSKGALLPLMRSLASAWGKDNIQVNCLLPGAINTPFLDTMVANPKKLEYLLGRIPLGRLGVAEDLVGPAIFLSAPCSNYVTGAEILVDGGGAALPMMAAQDPEAYKPAG